MLTRWAAGAAVAVTLALCACRESAAESPSSSAAPSSGAECGVAQQRDCPTQAWMKATLQAHLRTRDFKRLESSFGRLAERSPQGFDGWSDIARAGAAAAGAGDEAGVRKTCQECHDRHRSRFRETRRKLELL